MSDPFEIPPPEPPTEPAERSRADEPPGKRDAIERFLQSHPDLDDEAKTYALACIDGDVL